MPGLPDHISLRAASPGDEPFLAEVYASTRRPELAAAGLPPEFVEPFLRQQFDTQSRAYPMQFPGVEQSVILVDRSPAGRTWVWRTEKEILLADISLLPEFRGRGVGTAVIRALQEEAGTRGLPIRLQVSEGGRVAALYRRLGFETTERQPLHEEMVWRPGGVAP